MSTPNYGDAVKKFARAGILPRWLLPIAPVNATIGKKAVLSEAVLGKAPGRYHERSDTWSGLGGHFVANGVSKQDYEEFCPWPTPNVGVLGRAFPGIDSDAVNDDARRLVEDALDDAFGRNAIYAERLRGTGPRRLYAFRCVDPKDPLYHVRTRHLTYEYAGETHKLDVIGHGGQYLITGTHPSGDLYKWRDGYELDALAPDLTEIDNADIERFLEAFTEILEHNGGQIVRASGGHGTADDIDIRDLEPVMSIETVLDGLKEIPNTSDAFLHRDDFVSALAAIRAALGKESLNPKVVDEIWAWATEDQEWCDDAYFDKIWKSLDRVRVPRDSLDRLFRRNGVRTHVKHVFNGEVGQYSDAIKKEKKKAKTGKSGLLDTVATRYLFGHINTREHKSSYTMRDQWGVDREWPAYDWWRMELAESDKTLINDLQDTDSYNATRPGLANFLRDLQAEHPDIFYSGETRHPGYDKGEIFRDPQPDGTHRNLINMRYLSQAIRHGRKPDPNPPRSKADVAHILDFAKRLFGPMVDYELDTMAYMAQTGDRPGSLLFLVGDQGVGKSIWLQMQMALFDGLGMEGSAIIDGAKLVNENARRFILARVEGSRIVTIKELPEGSSARDMAAITSVLKQIVDPGPDGDFIVIEAKGENARPVRNFARVLISSNYANSIHVEQNDRRIFYVKAAITLENKPDEEYYGQLVDVTKDPERLAALWRYLKNRDIDKYTRYTAPPVSTEKAERIVAEIAHPPTRHMKAAMEWFLASDRTMFDIDELADLMTDLAKYEYVNSGGAVDDRMDYRATNGKGVSAFMNALRAVPRNMAIRLDRNFRTAKKRYPAVFVMIRHQRVLADLMAMEREQIFKLVDAEYERGLCDTHPWGLFRKPAKIDEA